MIRRPSNSSMLYFFIYAGLYLMMSLYRIVNSRQEIKNPPINCPGPKSVCMERDAMKPKRRMKYILMKLSFLLKCVWVPFAGKDIPSVRRLKKSMIFTDLFFG
jgi:hypothetical protein